ncbi:MAG: hypothetical protein ACE5QW_02720 [Thermoplasmata archaeon]
MVNKQIGQKVGFAEALADFAQPLIDATDGSYEDVSKALMFATLCWNLALLDDDRAIEELAEQMGERYREDFGLSVRDAVEFRLAILDMVERHRRMFPAMHKREKRRARERRKERKKSLRFEKCPVCGASVKSKNMARHLERVHPRPRIPSPGTLWRFKNTHQEWLNEALPKIAEELRDEGFTFPEVDAAMEEFGYYYRKAEREGHLSVIVEVIEERDRRMAKGEDEKMVTEWAYDLCYHLLLDWQVGFEDYLYGQFFAPERCKNCTREDKEDLLCEDGLSDCLFDDEFELFQREYVNRVIDKLCRGVQEPEEILVPAEIRRRAEEYQEFSEKARAILDYER